MLNRLKNNEIHAFFRNYLENGREPIAWLDLGLLSQALQKIPSPQVSEASDLEVEALLYGTAHEPYFSAFTENRVQAFLDAFGSAELRWVEADSHDSGLRNSILQQAHLNHPFLHSKKAELALRKVTRLKFREQRKRMLRKLSEGACRLREKLNLRKLPLELKLNLGAGEETHPGYLKVDWAGRQDIFDDIITLKKIADQSVDEIYTNHVLEHIPLPCIDSMLARWFQVLKPGGILRLRTPDAKQAVMKMGSSWSEVEEREIAELGFPNYLRTEPERQGSVSDAMAIQFIYGWSDVMPGIWDASNQHKSMWTPTLTKIRLERAGFDVNLSQNFGTLQTIAVAVKPK